MNTKHIYPKSIANEVKMALSYYPELKDVAIEFKFKKNIRKSTMQAQPTIGTVFLAKKKRKYVVLISKTFRISDNIYQTKDIPPMVLIGWFGHELGHIMDYHQRSGFNLIGFGLGYLFSERFMKKAERDADTFAVMHGMEDYILATKNFILNEAGFLEKYKNRIKRFYLSPEEIMMIVQEREDNPKLFKENEN
ncbi:hypothetical protein [Confluentibacter citreus]|uniref:hypothetical protein n=1 Tax=Confluentibacter citreus TaxID=2007307 RepID=UPI000C295797|nr:hypothetical protein [Confluentibacter citreus]